MYRVGLPWNGMETEERLCKMGVRLEIHTGWLSCVGT